MDDISLVINNKKINFPIFIKIFLIMMVCILILLLKCKISLYDKYDAKVIKEGDNYYIQTFVPISEQSFIHNEKILVDNKEYKYKVIKIYDEYVAYNNKNYMVVLISIDLDKSYMIENNYIKLNVKKAKKSLFSITIEQIKKGMNL